MLRDMNFVLPLRLTGFEQEASHSLQYPEFADRHNFPGGNFAGMLVWFVVFAAGIEAAFDCLQHIALQAAAYMWGFVPDYIGNSVENQD